MARTRLGEYEVVGVYFSAYGELDEENWTIVKTKSAKVFPLDRRPKLINWPTGRGMRRWAHRISSRGNSHRHLYRRYKCLLKEDNLLSAEESTEEDIELSAFEGKLRKQFIKHRSRENKLRAAKTRDALKKGDGHLSWEVLGCGFDFYKTYGELGRLFAIVHHLRPLADRDAKGGSTSLEDLAIVCANCHAMIHGYGECRPIESLMSETKDER